MKTSYTFIPRTKILFDWVLHFVVFLILLSVFNLMPAAVLFTGGVFVALCFVWGWFFWVRPVFMVTIVNGTITGPSPQFTRQSFPLRKLDHSKILLRTRKQKIVGFRDLYSIDGIKIRLCHCFLGKLAVYEIMEIVEKYPFRQSAAGTTGE